MSVPRPAFRFEPEWRITLFVVILVPLMAALGLWQLQRAEYKSALARDWDQRRAQPPAPLAELWDRPAAALGYTPVRLRGRLLEGSYFLLDNRVREGRFGYEVLAIMALAGGTGVALVNRGWVAGDPARLSLPQVPAADAELDTTGYVYVAPGEPYLLGEQQLQPGWPKVVQAVEMDKLAPAIADVAGGRLFPFPVRLDGAAAGALAADWAVINVSPSKHRGYAVQWFTMSAVLAIFYLLRSSNLWHWLRRDPGSKQDR